MNTEQINILNYHITREKLSSGLTLLLQPGGRVPIASVYIWVKRGSSTDPEARSGVAHFLEHMMFTGTTRFPEGEFDKWAESHGGQINAGTWLDWTYYQTDIPSRQIVTLIAYEADRFRNLTFEAERFEREKKVILGERRDQVDGDPDSLLSEFLWRKCKENSRYERPTIGYEDEIKGLARSDLLQIYRESYHNKNLVICVCGQFDAEEVRSTIQTEFEIQSVPDQLQITSKGKSPKRFQTGFLGQLRLPLLNERLLIALPTPRVDTRTFAALEIVHQVLFEGESASVHRDLVVEQEIASHVSGFLPGLEEEGLYEICIEMLEPDSEAKFIDYLGTTLEQIAKTGLTPAELNRCRNRAELEALECLQTADQRAYQFGFWETVTGHCNALQVRLNQYAELTNEDIRSAVQNWWSRERIAWVIGRRSHD